MAKPKSDTKNKIMDAAIEIFSEKGFKGATIREICLKAEQSVGSINYHFRDKDGLYEVCIKQILEDLILKHQPEPENSADLSASEKLEFFIKAYVNRFSSLFSESDKQMKGIMLMREILDPSETFKKWFVGYQARQIDYLLGIISELTDKPVSDPNVMRSAISIVGQCFQFVFGRKIFGLLGIEAIHAEELNLCVAHIVQFSLGGIKTVVGESK